MVFFELLFAFGISVLSVFFLLAVALVSAQSACYGKALSKRVLAVISSLLLLALLFGEWYVFQFLCGPWSSATSSGASIILAMIVWSYLQAALTNPGTPATDDWQSWQKTLCAATVDAQTLAAKAALSAQNQQEQTRVALDGGCNGIGSVAACWLTYGADSTGAVRAWPDPALMSYCSKCEQLRPARAHHCARCGLCVMGMDHHCSVIGNCVGLRNFKPFVVLNFWQTLGCMVFLLTPGGPGSELFGHALHPGPPWRRTLLVFACGQAFMMLVVSTRALILTIYLASRNETFVESHFSGKNPHAHKSMLSNFEEFFGPLDWKAMLPLRPTLRRPLASQGGKYRSTDHSNIC